MGPVSTGIQGNLGKGKVAGRGKLNWRWTKETPPSRSWRALVTLQVGPGRPDGRYSSGSAVVEAGNIVDHAPKPLLAGARFWARTR